ncbi:MAG: alginate export family protein [Sphingomonas sp.]|uniref:alginate export family protein n=1 Tax=Sphingomonas sp. TaxID=28214 RepID=UPI001B2C91FE|nr:alginate export family protein [Sphingomonas sp.]MBO9623700.1 alginate export family protein [Sphingomonas sp.]
MTFSLDRSPRTALFSLAVLSSLAAAPARADDGDGSPKLTIDGSTRVRFEALDGQFRPNTAEKDVFVSFRTTVAAQLDLGPVAFGGEVVDARGYAQDDRSSVRTSEINALEPVQAYVALKGHDMIAAGDHGTLTAGRFSLDLGSQRLVSRTDFPNTVTSYLGGLVDWSDKNKNRLVAFWTHPFSALPDDVDGIFDNDVELDRAGKNLAFFGAWGSAPKAFGKIGVEAYVYRLAENDVATRQTRNRHLVTFGSRIRQAPAKGKFDFEVEGALQRGQVRGSTSAADLRDLDVRAGFGHAEAGWTFTSSWAPRVSAVFDYASGDSKDPDSYGRFDTLYGSRRGDYGPLALFGPVGRANLISPGVRLEAKPSKRFDMMTMVRGLWLADATDSFASTSVRDASGASGTYAGTQVEVRLRRWLLPQKVRMDVGGAYLAKGRFLKDAPNAPATGDTRYGFVDLVYNF